MKNCAGNGKLIRELFKTVLAVVCTKDNVTKLSVLLLLLALVPIGADAHAIQEKACPGLVCSLDKPVRDGDLLVVIGAGGCDPRSILPSPQGCNTVSDNQANLWQIAEIVPNNNGTILWYAINARGGTVTIYRSVGSSGTIVAEYPPALGLEDANEGTYTSQNHGDAPQGASSDIGHTEPVEVTFPRDLVISWATAGSLGHNYTAGPFFSLEGATPDGALAFEDMIAVKPGLYMGTMGWDTYAHWTMGVAAFRMGTIEIENPSFEETSAPLAPSPLGLWNNGPIHGWSQSGNTGLWQPLVGAAGAMQVPDGKTIVWMDTGAISQDLGDTSAKPYTLSVSIGNRWADGTWTISLYAGATVLCTTSGSLSAIPPGSFATETLPCNVPAGDLTIGLSLQGHAALDNVRLTTTDPSSPTKLRRQSKIRESGFVESAN